MWFSSRKTRWNTRVRSFRRTLPLRLETLEDRTVPSTFTVLNTLDNGTGSLRQAILDANANLGADVIHFAPGVTGTITLTSGELDIIDDVDLQGPGSGVVTVSGNNASLVFRVSAKATISGLTITRGSSSNGGGIYNTGTLTVENSTFDGNTGATVYNPGFAVVAPYYSQVGSGIYNDNGGMATVSGSTFSNNTGSGIYNYSVGSTTTVIVSDSTFSGNQAGEGGGIFSLGATLTVSNSTFSGNSASGVPKNSGGGINCSIGGTLTVSNSTFSDNQAGYGGGISVSFGVTATVNKSTFSGNRAFVAAGGIFNFQATLTVTNSIIAGNTSPLGPDIWGPVTSNGYNLIGDASASSGFGALDMVGLYVVVGTAGVDSLTVAPGSQAGTLKTTVNGVVTDNIAFSGIVLVEGLGGNDTITITASLAGGVVVDGGDGSDTYNISFGNLAGPVTVADRGPSTDTNTLNATGSPDSNTANYIVKTTGKITWGPSSTPTETVTYSGIQPVNIYGGAGTNVITDPGGQTTITGGPRQNTITITATSGNGVVLNGGTSTSTNNYFINK